jgi:hypothetical protein
MAYYHDAALSGANGALDVFEPGEIHQFPQSLFRQRANLNPRKKVGGETAEMLAGHSAKFGTGLLSAESDREIMQGKPAILSPEMVSAEAQRPADPPYHLQRQRPEDRGRGPIDDENEAIHAGGDQRRFQ